jgi:hypothetical protein
MRSVSSRLRGLWHSVVDYRVENPGLKLLALLLATLLFAISRQPISDVRLVGVQLEYRGLAQGLEISGGEVNETVSVRLRGPRDIVRNIMPNQIAVVADMTNKESGDRVIQLKTRDVSAPEGIEVLQIDPGTIRLRIEPTTRKRVKVDPDVVGQVKDGFEIYRVTINPPIVEIQGPESQVAQVESVSTESIQLFERTSSFVASVDVDHPNHSIRVVTPGLISLAFEIGEVRSHRKLSVPVSLAGQDARARLLTPAVMVELYGPRTLLDSLTPERIRVEIQASGAEGADGQVVPKVVLPAEIRNRVEITSLTPPEVRFKP